LGAMPVANIVAARIRIWALRFQVGREMSRCGVTRVRAILAEMRQRWPFALVHRAGGELWHSNEKGFVG
jgi:hypothetical protein